MTLTPALLHPIAVGALPPPSLSADRGFYLRADADPALSQGWARGLLCVQSFKPAFDRLTRQGLSVVPNLSGGDYGFGLLALTKHKIENLAALAQALTALRPGGRLICAGPTDAGGAATLKAARLIQPDLPSLAKYHCKIFWLTRPETPPPILADWAAAGARQFVPAIGAQSQPGLYNWNKVDAGSALLAQHLPEGATGRAADFGSGWGYLSLALQARSPGLTALDLYEAEALAEPVAVANLAAAASPVPTRFFWRDLAADPPAAAYDLVVMNPPFHEGKAADLDLGRRCIAAAAAALVPGGRLLMVANRHLPYEQPLDAALTRRRLVAETSGYKILEAWRA